MRKLHPQDRRLDRVESTIEALDVMVIAAALPVIPQLTNALDNVGPVADDGPAVAVRTKVLAGIEAERGGVTERANAAALVPGAVRLACILDHDQPPGSGELED